MNGSTDNSVDYCVHRGCAGAVFFAEIKDGSCPSKKFWEERTIGEQAKFMSLFRKIAGDPDLQLRNREQFKVVRGDLFAFKRNDLKMRVFAFREGKCWYLLCGMTGKKENQLPEKEIQWALDYMEEARVVLKKPMKGKVQ